MSRLCTEEFRQVADTLGDAAYRYFTNNFFLFISSVYQSHLLKKRSKFVYHVIQILFLPVSSMQPSMGIQWLSNSYDPLAFAYAFSSSDGQNSSGHADFM